MSAGGQLTAGSLILGAVALVLALVHVTAVAAVALAIGGLAWVLALSTLNSAYQLTLPGWVKSRGMSFYLIVFQGGNAAGSAVLGVMAQHAGLTAAFVTVAVALVVGPLAALRFRIQSIPPESLLPVGDWPAPQLTAADSEGPAGPVMVTIEYRPLAGQRGDLVAALRGARFSRRRTGAIDWRAWQDATDPDRIVEQFVVASWDEHLRQHERVTRRDAERLARIRAMTDPGHPVIVTHWLTPGQEVIPTRISRKIIRYDENSTGCENSVAVIGYPGSSSLTSPAPAGVRRPGRRPCRRAWHRPAQRSTSLRMVSSESTAPRTSKPALTRMASRKPCRNTGGVRLRVAGQAGQRRDRRDEQQRRRPGDRVVDPAGHARRAARRPTRAPWR